MTENNYKKIILDGFVPTVEKKYIIYGTGKISDIFFEEIENVCGEEAVVSFINEVDSIKTYRGKPVKKCEDLEEADIAKCEFVLATVSKMLLFMDKLFAYGVKREQIHCPITMFSVDCFEQKREIIKRVVIYPEIKSKKKLSEIYKEFVIMSYIEKLKDVEFIFLTDFEERQKDNISFRRYKNYEYKEGDLIWVYSAENAMDIFLKDKSVVCCDDEFLYHSVERMHFVLNNKLGKIVDKYKWLSKSNYLRLKNSIKKYDYVTVCGMGPSLNSMNDTIKKFINNGMCVVCNDFACLDSDLEADVYIIQDNAYLSCQYAEILQRIIDLVVKKELYLVVDEKWLLTLLTKYPQIEKYVIGLKKTDKMVIPDENNMLYCHSNNVVSAMCLPFAASCFDDIYIVGCDGHNRCGGWEHSTDEYTRKSTFHDAHFLMINNVEDIFEYEDKIKHDFDRIFKYSVQKKFKLLSKSTYIKNIQVIEFQEGKDVK